MRYLVVCDHVKKTIEADAPDLAIMELPCKKCVGYDLRKGKSIQKSARVYSWDGPDIDARVLPREKKEKV